MVASQDSVIRDLCEVILRSHGFIVDQAETLVDVRALVTTRPVFACLLDCRRHAGRGMRLLREVSEVGLVHTVALVDSGRGEIVASALSEGANAVVECPFKNQELIAAVEGLPESCAETALGGAL